MKIAINGFGRIGKNFLRTILQNKETTRALQVVAINIGPSNPEFIEHLFKYDTIMGTYPRTVTLDDGYLIVDNQKIKILMQPDASKLDWKSLDIDWVVDCSGKFTKRADAEKHIKAGARYVLISAPAHDEDVSIIPGVNDAMFNKKKHKIVSLGSCTTNALLPMLKVLHESCGLQQGFMTTMHAYTNSQSLLDVDGKDPRRARAAALNIIPTTTGASTMVAKIIPALQDKIKACAIRVPVGIVSLLEIVFYAQRSLTTDFINDAFKQASKKSLQGIVDITMEPLVSSDFKGTHYSVVVDGLMTNAMGSMGQVFGWYDNEWAYSLRLKDFLIAVEQS